MERAPHRDANFGRLAMPWLAALAVLLALLAASGTWLWHDQRQRVAEQRFAELAAIGQLKAEAIVRWREDRLGDAAYLTSGSYLRVAMLDLVGNPRNDDARAAVERRLEQARAFLHYDALLLVDAQGRIVAAAGHAPAGLYTTERELLRDALASSETRHSNFYPTEVPGRIRLSIAAPLGDGAASPVAALVLRRDPHSLLFPALQRWPTGSPSAETLLVRRELDHVVYINPLRHRDDGAMTTRIPVSQTDVVAVRVVLGESGRIEGKDYRGREVVADARLLSGTDWAVIAKVDREEILAEARVRGRGILVIVLLSLLLATAIGLAFVSWRQQQWFRELYAAERRRRQAELETAATLYSVGEGVVTTDEQGRIARMNPVACTLTGWSEEEARGRPLGEVVRLVDERDRAERPSPLTAVLHEGATIGSHADVLLLARDGREIPVAEIASPIRDVQARTLGLVLVLRDQTREHELRTQLAADAEQLRVLLERANDGIVLLDDDGAVLVANERFATMLGRDPATVTSLHVWDWDCALDTREKFLAVYPRVPTRPGLFDARFCRADGTAIDVSVSHAPVRWGDRNASLAICRDVTERRRTEDALRQSAQQFRTFAEFVPMLTWMTTADGHPYYFNQRWYDYAGLAQASPPGPALRAALHPAEVEHVFEQWDSCVRTGSPFAAELRLRRHDGTYRWFMVRALPIRDTEGVVLRWLGVANDIDDMKNAQAVLEQNLELRTRDLKAALEQAERANRVKDIFLATMSHELRTPLNSIIGFSELMLAGIAGELNEEQRRQLGIVSQSGHQLLGLITEVLDISRIETGQLAMQVEPLGLARLLDEQRQAFELTAAERGLRLEVRAPDPDILVSGDTKRVRQVLGNLLSNAIKYTDAGTVVVSTATVGDEAVICVEDSGIGIAAADLPNLFRPFYRATSTHGGQREGTGLGLAVSRRLAAAMGGTVDVESEVGKGSRFRFRLPLATPPS